MVLLTGLGDNAHVYDQFAFQFTDYFHVIGITRRGFLPSSQPRNGYDVPTRAADDVAVFDALGINKAVFVGHSLSGSEFSELGLKYRARVDKLVYLDAADLSERFRPSRREPPGAQPLFTAAAFKSLWAYQAASARYTAIRQPNQSVSLNLKFSADGAIVDFTSPQFVTDKLLAGVAGSVNPPVDWSGIKTPRLWHVCSVHIYRQGKPGTGTCAPPRKPNSMTHGRPLPPGIDGRLGSLPTEMRLSGYPLHSPSCD